MFIFKIIITSIFRINSRSTITSSPGPCMPFHITVDKISYEVVTVMDIIFNQQNKLTNFRVR